MKIASFYGIRQWEKFKYLQDCVGELLPSKLGDCSYFPYDQYSIQNRWRDVQEGFDIAYWDYGTFREKPILYNKRPAKFVYSIFLERRKKHIFEFIEKNRPDFVGCLQHVPSDLVTFGKKYNCVVEFFPWWLRDWKIVSENKSVLAMCTGCVNKSYPKRTNLFNYLKSLNRNDIIISGQPEWDIKKLSYLDYYIALAKSKFYFTAGIRDIELPQKVLEVCQQGCCLVCFPIPYLKECGFVNGIHYTELNSLEEIPEILDRQDWEVIGNNAQKLVEKYHTVYNRRDRILQLYKERYGEVFI